MTSKRAAAESDAHESTRQLSRGRLLTIPNEADVRHGLSGNLCRCGGYNQIVAEVLDAAKRPTRKS